LVQTSPTVLAFPSSQAVPVGFKVQAVWLVATVHCWHWFVGLVVPPA
jgi:hypothetical protein